MATQMIKARIALRAFPTTIESGISRLRISFRTARNRRCCRSRRRPAHCRRSIEVFSEGARQPHRIWATNRRGHPSLQASDTPWLRVVEYSNVNRFRVRVAPRGLTKSTCGLEGHDGPRLLGEGEIVSRDGVRMWRFNGCSNFEPLLAPFKLSIYLERFGRGAVGLDYYSCSLHSHSDRAISIFLPSSHSFFRVHSRFCFRVWSTKSSSSSSILLYIWIFAWSRRIQPSIRRASTLTLR